MNTNATAQYAAALRQLAAAFVLAAMLLIGAPAGVALSEDHPPIESQDSTQDTVIETGDAVAETTIENDANTNTTEVGGAPSEETTESSEPSTEESNSSESSGDEGGAALQTEGDKVPPEALSTLDAEEEELMPASGTTTVTNDNDATIENTASTSAETGSNTAQGGGGSAAINTGNALAAANVINVVNTNIFNSQGLIALLNLLFGGGDVDLSDFSFGGHSTTSSQTGCSLASCNSADTTVVVDNDNDASIVNDIMVRSATGGNDASSEGGDASIATGNAYAAANVINVANSNFVNSNYLLLALNSFGGMGDLILPGKTFFENFFAGGAGLGGSTDVVNTNTATVENSVEVSAETGGNEAETGEGSALVDTGNAVAGVNVVNQVNSNFLGGSNFYLLLRIHGNWAGNIFSPPPGISWTEGPGGVQLFSDPDTAGGAGVGPSSLTVENNNAATIHNNIGVYALTGDNKVSSESGEATIDTGDAYAAANVVNIVNTNVIGRNWMFLILNIFGDWGGNIAFGRPDLWLGGSASGSGSGQPGEKVTYTFTISNRGSADATNVVLKTSGLPHLSFDMPGPWNIGTVVAGETIEVAYTASVKDTLPYGTSPQTLSVSASSHETDDNTADNIEEVTVSLVRIAPNPGAPRPDVETLDPIWTLKKSVATSTLHAGESATYTIVIQNDGGPAYDAVLSDTLRNEEGDVVKINEWALDTVFDGEEIRLTYTMAYGTAMEPGLYTNEARVYARSRSTAPQYSVDAHSGSASVAVTLLPALEETHVLELSNVRITAIGGTRDHALIEWDTNIPATSQVVYGPENAGYAFDPETDGYHGYPAGSEKVETKTTHHRVLLTGLTPGAAYKYRAVSFASPGMGSDEYAFVLPPISTPVPAASGKLAMANVMKQEMSGEFEAHKRMAAVLSDAENGSAEGSVQMMPTSSRLSLASVAHAFGGSGLTEGLLLALSLVGLGYLVRRRMS